jgi:hypothetical protein
VTNIFVEGIADKKFITDLILDLFTNFPNDVEIIKCGGWQNLDKVEPKFKEIDDFGGNNIIIFDADANAQNRRAEIMILGQKLNINFDLFLLPNDRDPGNLETLLLSIINPTHNAILTCFEDYKNCLSQNSNYNLPCDKAKVYAYTEALTDGILAKEEKRDYLNNNHWHLSKQILDPLKAFLTNHL